MTQELTGQLGGQADRSTTSGEPRVWWEGAVIYEVYPRSFADSDGDGVGDLRGVINRLPYLASLRVDGIWLTPFQRSPQADQGYDVSDYCDVDPMFGTLADFDELLSAAHAVDIRIVIDLVPNHCSIAHPSFQAAIAAGPGSAERELFHFSAGGPGGTPPNNWMSVFGGPAWSRVAPDSTEDTEWYLHLFSPEQPDWNWRNSSVGDYFEDVLRFWLDRGVDGVRIDVAHGLYKTEGLPDSPEVPTVIDGLRSNPLAMDQEPVHEVYRRWRRVAEQYEPPRLLVGEVNLKPDRAGRYTRPDELHQTFAFAFTHVGWDADEWKRIGEELDAVRRDYGSSPTWALENHDVVRAATRFGGGELGRRRAQAALVAMLGFPGASYVFQGQELGLAEVDVPLEARRDPMWSRGGVSRDGVRVPLPWQIAAAGSFGFSSPLGSAAPWLPQPAGWGEWAIESQDEDPTFPLAAFRRAVGARRILREQDGTLNDLSSSWEVDDHGVLVCRRAGGLLVVVNMGPSAVPMPAGVVVVASTALEDSGLLPPDTAVWLRPAE